MTLPAQVQAGAPVLSDPRPYQTGGTKFCMREVPAILVDSDPAYTASQFLPLDTWGGKRWEHVQKAALRSLKEIQTIAAIAQDDYVSGFVADAGLGKPGTEAWGWALCNGNNGTADLRGMFVLGYNPDRGNDGRGNNLSTNTVGSGGGAETHRLAIPEMPIHDHDIDDGFLKQTGSAVSGASNGSGASGAAGKTRQAGGGQPHNNMPPHYVMVMRQWVGID